MVDSVHTHVSYSEPSAHSAPDHQHHHRHNHHREHPPSYPPPSYDDATGSALAPLLVAPPPDYGAVRAYSDADESSIASSEIEGSDQTLPEWIGQALVVIAFLGIIYAFLRVINMADNIDGYPG